MTYFPLWNVAEHLQLKCCCKVQDELEFKNILRIIKMTDTPFTGRYFNDRPKKVLVRYSITQKGAYMYKAHKHNLCHWEVRTPVTLIASLGKYKKQGAAL